MGTQPSDSKAFQHLHTRARTLRLCARARTLRLCASQAGGGGRWGYGVNCSQSRLHLTHHPFS